MGDPKRGQPTGIGDMGPRLAGEPIEASLGDALHGTNGGGLNGGNDTDAERALDALEDREIRLYSTSERQRDLKRAIEAQDLPVRKKLYELKVAIAEAGTRGGILLLQGETGSGKSIYSPIALKEVLDEFGLPPNVVVMQPRRDAASGIARAIAAVTDEELGHGVGFSTSEQHAFDRNTRIRVTTPGIFLRHIREGGLDKKQTGAVVIDELHEGSVEYHLVLGLLKRMRAQGDAPFILLTSATLDKERIMSFFDIPKEDYQRIEGRTYNVRTDYITEAETKDGRGGEISYISICARKAAQYINDTEQGDVLVFLPGAREIEDAIRQIKSAVGEDCEVLPLHGGLKPEERDRALWVSRAREKQRRVVVSTNIAETSVTVPGIRYVVDSCRQRSVRFNPKTGIEERGTEYISKDQAEQRAGRAGRVQEGECVRVVTSQEYDTMPEHPQSEIRRTNLSHVVLTLRKWGIDPSGFDFIEQPDAVALAHGEKELKTLGALSEDGELTKIGEKMGDMPFEPRLARMLVEARQRGCSEAALVLAAFAREGNVFFGPSRKDEAEASGWNAAEKKKNARNKVQAFHAQEFGRGGSDWLRNLEVMRKAMDQGVIDASSHRRSPEQNAAWRKFQDWCKENYLDFNALTHIAYRLRDYARYARVNLDFRALGGILKNASDSDLATVILSGNPDGILYLASSGPGMAEYRRLTGDHSMEINISPGSGTINDKPKLIVPGNIKEGKGTARGKEIIRNYAEDVQPIALAQMRQIAPHLIEEASFNAPYYDAQADGVVQNFRVYPKRVSSITLGEEARPVEGDEAVRVFASALAQGELSLPCVEKNKAVLAELQGLYHRSRGMIQPPTTMQDWYAERLNGAHSAATATALGDTLLLRREDFYSEEQLRTLNECSPESVEIDGTVCGVEYQYQPERKSAYGSYPEEYRAVITIDPEAVMGLTDDYIPNIGMAGEPPLRIVIRTGVNGMPVEKISIAEVKDVIDNKRLERIWYYETEKPQERALDIQTDELLPDDIGAVPIQYAVSHDGKPVFMYPCISHGYRYDENRVSSYNYFIEYVRLQANAEERTTESRRVRGKEIEEARRSRVYKEQSADATTILSVVEQEVGRLTDSFDKEASIFSRDELAGLERQVKDASGWLSGKDLYGYKRTQDPVRALELLGTIQSSIETRRRVVAERADFIDQARHLQEEVEPLVKKILYSISYESYGISYDDCRKRKEEWKEAVQLIENPRGDARKATELLSFLFNYLEKIDDKHNKQIWSTPEAQRFTEKFEREGEAGVSARITVYGNGWVYRFGTAGSLEKIPLGGGNDFIVGVDDEHTGTYLVKVDSRGNRLGLPFRIQRGAAYIIFQDGEIFSVEFGKDGEVSQVLPSPEFYEQAHGIIRFPERLMGEDNDAHGVLAYASQTRQQDPPTGSGLGTMAAALKGISVRPAKREEETIMPVVQAKRVESPKQTVEIMTDELRAGFAADLDFAEALLKDVTAYGAKDDKAKKRRKDLGATLSDIRASISSEHAEPKSILGRIGGMMTDIDKLFKNIARGRSDNYDSDWIARLRSAWDAVTSEVDASETAQEFIAEDLTTRDELIARAREQLMSAAAQMRIGTAVMSAPEAFEKALEIV